MPRLTCLSTRPVRRADTLLAAVVRALTLALTLAVSLAPVPATAATPLPTTLTTPTTTAAATGDPDIVRGVLERLAVEGPTGQHGQATRSGAITTWVHAAERHVRIAPEAVASVPTGSQIVVRLRPAGTDDAVHAVRSLTVLTRSSASAVPKVAAAAAPHQVTVLLALPAGAHPDAMTVARLTTAITGGASRYWSQQSGGRITFAVTRAQTWLRMQHGCSDVWGLWDETRQRTGFVPGPRRHLLLYVPTDAGCPSGLGTVAPSADAGGYVLVGGATTGLLAHELGHNLGLGHSDALTCAGAADAVFIEQWPAGCTHDDYGDWYDVMGISWDNVGTLSTAHAYRLGLLGSGSALSVSGPARVVLRPVSQQAGLRSLRVTDPDGAVYVVEYRPASGADAWLDTAADWRGLRGGVLVRRVDPQDSTRTLLLDATPSASVSASDWNRPLGPGQSLRTSSGRVTVRVESQVAGAATVVVDVDDVSPAYLLEPGGRLVNGAQVTIGDAPAAWAAQAPTPR